MYYFFIQSDTEIYQTHCIQIVSSCNPMNKGTYIVLEWTVWTGKSTQIKNLAKHLETTYPEKELLVTREPGGTPIAEATRTLVQWTEFDNDEMGKTCETYLYAAARAQLIETLIWPALERWAIVLSDRSIVSSLAYQWYAYKYGIERVLDVNRPILLEYFPDCILFLDIDPEVGISRTFDATGDKHERNPLSFFNDLRTWYAHVSKIPQFSAIRKTIDASWTPQEVEERLNQALQNVI